MQEFFKRFTLVDFMAMFIPGAFVALLLNWWEIVPVKLLCTKFFGENGMVLSVYFVILSYVIGTLFHECGKPLERILVVPPESYFHAPEKNKSETEERRLLREDLCGKDGRKRSPEEAYSFVKAAVQGKGSYQKRLLFSSFYGMSRTFLVVVPVMLAVLLLTGKAHWLMNVIVFPTCEINLIVTVILNVFLLSALLILLGMRARRFHKLSLQYTFHDYINLKKAEGDKGEKL